MQKIISSQIRRSRLRATRLQRLLSAFIGSESDAAPLSTTESALGSATDVSEEASSTTINIQPWRIWFVVTCFGIFALLILLRLVSYQIFRWGEVAYAAVPESAGHVARGVVVDRDGELLAADRFFYQISAEPRRIETDDARLAVAQTLEKLVGIPAAQTFQQLIENANRAHLPIGDLISLDAGNRLLDWKATDAESTDPILVDVFVTAVPKRYYPQNELGSHIIGFVNSESVRRANYGIERYYNPFLRQDGVGLTGKKKESLASLSPTVRRFMPSVAGKDLVLTMDRTIQWIIEEELRENVDFYRAQSGTIIVMEPQTGAILGMANWPSYNPNQYSETEFMHFINPAISAQYEPGSIFKVVTMAAALDLGATEPSARYIDSGEITIGGRTIYNSDRTAAGEVTATTALAQSLNVVMAEIASQVGAEDFYRYVRRMGFGQATEIDLAGEVPGLVKAPGNLDWSLSDLGTNSFGQGLAVTPIQMISAVAAFANGGMLMRPYIVQARVHNEDVQMTQPTIVRQVVTPETAATLTAMMVDVVKTGNQGAIVSGYTVAGKSGTAEIPTEEGYTLDETIVSFVGFAPAKDPRFVMLVKLDRPDPDISRWASQTAAPVFSRVAARLLSHMNVPPGRDQ